MQFNGNDQIRLVKKSDSTVMDRIGINGNTFSVGSETDAGDGHCLLRRPYTAKCDAWTDVSSPCRYDWKVEDRISDCGLMKPYCVIDPARSTITTNTTSDTVRSFTTTPQISETTSNIST